MSDLAIRLNAPPKKRVLLSHVRGNHRFYLEPDGRVIVADDSGTHGDPEAPFHLAMAEWRITPTAKVSVPVVHGTGSLGIVIESAAGGLQLASELYHRGYTVKVNSYEIADLITLSKYVGQS